MKTKYLAPVAAFASFLGTFALAETPLNNSQLDALLSGNTLYLEINKDGDIAPIYFETDGDVTAQLPNGPKLVGKWEIQSENYCVNWDNGPKNSCTQLIRGEDGFVAMDMKKGEARGTVTKIFTGNTENF